MLEPVFRAGESFPHDPAITGDLEILSLAGTLAPTGAHLHMSVAEASGGVVGGHLCAGSVVRTTAELVLALLPHWQFHRDLDPATGFQALQFRRCDPA